MSHLVYLYHTFGQIGWCDIMEVRVHHLREAMRFTRTCILLQSSKVYLFEVILLESKSSHNPHKPHKAMYCGPVKSKNDMRALRYAGVIQLLFFNRIPIFYWCLVRWGSKHKHHKDTCLNENALCLQFLLITPCSIANYIGSTHVYSSNISNKYALPTIVTKSRKVLFSTSCLLMLHHGFADAAQVLMCE